MSEATAEAAVVPVPVAPESVEPQGDPVELGDGGKKALEAERKRANALDKQLKAFQAEREAAEAEKLTELERAQKAAKEASERLAEYEKTTMRQKVALDTGLPAALVARLQGDDEESLIADAESLMALLNTPTTPKPDPSQGAKGEAAALNGDPLLSTIKNKLGLN
jgi:hypothetical protein